MKITANCEIVLDTNFSVTYDADTIHVHNKYIPNQVVRFFANLDYDLSLVKGDFYGLDNTPLSEQIKSAIKLALEAWAKEHLQNATQERIKYINDLLAGLRERIEDNELSIADLQAEIDQDKNRVTELNALLASLEKDL